MNVAGAIPGNTRSGNHTRFTTQTEHAKSVVAGYRRAAHYSGTASLHGYARASIVANGAGYVHLHGRARVERDTVAGIVLHEDSVNDERRTEGSEQAAVAIARHHVRCGYES